MSNPADKEPRKSEDHPAGATASGTDSTDASRNIAGAPESKPPAENRKASDPSSGDSAKRPRPKRNLRGRGGAPTATATHNHPDLGPVDKPNLERENLTGKAIGGERAPARDAKRPPRRNSGSRPDSIRKVGDKRDPSYNRERPPQGSRARPTTTPVTLESAIEANQPKGLMGTFLEVVRESLDSFKRRLRKKKAPATPKSPRKDSDNRDHGSSRRRKKRPGGPTGGAAANKTQGSGKGGFQGSGKRQRRRGNPGKRTPRGDGGGTRHKSQG